MLTTYQSALYGKEMEVLKGILDDADVEALLPFVAAVVPTDVDDWQGFHADIMHSPDVQQVGYLT